MIKALFFDMDNTLVIYPRGEIPTSACNAIDSLRKQGVLICAATGRHRVEMENIDFLQSVAFDAVAALNGQYCYCGDRDLFVNALCPQDIETYFSRYNYPCIVSEKHRTYINYHTDAFAAAEQGIASSLPPVGDMENIADREILQLQVYCNQAQAQALSKDLPGSKTVRWNPDFVDLISLGGDKTKGIEAILKHFNITWAEVMAFGDGQNDIEMLKAAAIGVAMGNAEDEVKARADYVTAPANENGVALALDIYKKVFYRKA